MNLIFVSITVASKKPKLKTFMRSRFESIEVPEVDLKCFSAASINQVCIRILLILEIKGGKIIEWFRFEKTRDRRDK